jgi:hypothetical protein
MNREDIIRMAREAGDYLVDKRGREDFIFDSYGIERFAALVAAAEREACADVAENGLIGHTIAKAIRARGRND